MIFNDDILQMGFIQKNGLEKIWNDHQNKSMIIPAFFGVLLLWELGLKAGNNSPLLIIFVSSSESIQILEKT